MTRSEKATDKARRFCRWAGVALSLTFLCPVFAHAQNVFLKAIADLPLMPGLEEVEDASVVFDKPSGRIVEAFAKGAVGRSDVAGFYDKTLPQLGWQAEGGGSYWREGERLTLDVTESGRLLTVRFTLAPQ